MSVINIAIGSTDSTFLRDVLHREPEVLISISRPSVSTLTPGQVAERSQRTPTYPTGETAGALCEKSPGLDMMIKSIQEWVLSS